MSLNMQLSHLLVSCIFFLSYARLLSSNSKEVSIYGFPYKTVFVSKGLFRIFHTPSVILFLKTYLLGKKKIQHKPTNSSSWVGGGKTFSFTRVCKDRNAGTMEQIENENWRKGKTTCFAGSASLCCIEVMKIQWKKYSLRCEVCRNLQQNIWMKWEIF